MKLKFLLPALLTCLTLVFSACQDEDQIMDAPVPATEITLDRLFSYPNTVQVGISYSPSDLKVSAERDGTEFHFYTGVKLDATKDATGNDHINFTITPDKLKPGYVGSYNLKSVSDPNAGEAKAAFIHYTSNSGGRIFDSQLDVVEGQYEITAYDARHKLISGNYRVVIKDTADPYPPEEERHNPKKIKITVTGTFAHVPVK